MSALAFSSGELMHGVYCVVFFVGGALSRIERVV